MDALFPLIFLGAYFALQLWVFPRMGVPT